VADIFRQNGSPFAVSFETNIAEVTNTLDHTQKWVVPYAASTALSRAAYDARLAEMQKIAGIFDRPNPLTQKSVLYAKATADDLTYRIFIRDEASRGGTAPARYLRPQVKGGGRGPKPYELLLRRVGVLAPDEFTVPARGAKLDRYGNVPASVISKMLSNLKARRDVGVMQNTTARSAARNKRAGGAVYFAITEERRSGLPRGIYERSSRGQVRAVLIFIEGAPHYRARYDFGQAAIAKAERAFFGHFARAFTDMVNRNRKAA